MLIAICDDDKEFACELDQKIRSRFARFDEDNLLFNTLVFHSSKNLKEYLLQREHLEIDILFLDISMPEIDGFDIAELCFQLFPDISIIFVSDYEERVFYSLRFRPFRFLCKKNYKKYLPEALDAAIKLHAKAQQNILVKAENEYNIYRRYPKKYQHKHVVKQFCHSSLSIVEFGFLGAAGRGGGWRRRG